MIVEVPVGTAELSPCPVCPGVQAGGAKGGRRGSHSSNMGPPQMMACPPPECPSLPLIDLGSVAAPRLA